MLIVNPVISDAITHIRLVFTTFLKLAASVDQQLRYQTVSNNQAYIKLID